MTRALQACACTALLSKTVLSRSRTHACVVQQCCRTRATLPADAALRRVQQHVRHLTHLNACCAADQAQLLQLLLIWHLPACEVQLQARQATKRHLSTCLISLYWVHLLVRVCMEHTMQVSGRMPCPDSCQCSLLSRQSSRGSCAAAAATVALYPSRWLLVSY
jgi:hypothetical protein